MAKNNRMEDFEYQASQYEKQRRQKTQKIRALTDKQHDYMQEIEHRILTFSIGPAGTGKSYVAVSLAAEAFMNKEISQIIITRPVVEAGNSLGFLPGEQSEKYMPYIAPVYDILLQKMGKSQLEYALKVGQIRAIPLEMMRGLSFNDTWVILDEAQNVTKAQMKLFLTRIGRNCKVIVDGDIKQSDLKVESGLLDAVRRFYQLPDVGVVEFSHEDIVRSGIVKDIIMGYSD